MSSAIRRRGGRGEPRAGLVVSGLGFGLAYYFDTENGGARRAHLRRSLRRTASTIDSVWGPPEVADPPPVFTPLLRGLSAEEYETQAGPRRQAN